MKCLVTLSFLVPTSKNLEQWELKTEDNDEEQRCRRQIDREDDWRMKWSEEKREDGNCVIVE